MKVTPITSIQALRNQKKKRPGKEDYKPKYDPDKPPDGAA